MKTVEKEVTPAEMLTQSVGERAKNCVDYSVNAVNSSSAKARQIAYHADACVRNNPWLTMAAVAGVSSLVSFLFHNHRKS